MLKMVDGTGIIGVDMVCPLGGTVSPPQPPNYDRVELEGTGMLVLPNSLDAPLERLELVGKTEQVQTTGAQLFEAKNAELNKWVDSTGIIATVGRNCIFRLNVKPNTVYQVNILSASCTFSFSQFSKENVFLERTVFSKGTKSFKCTTTENVDYAYFLIGGTVDNINGIINDVMLYEGEEYKNYEPYTGGKPSPSPEYPQEIKNVGKWNEETQKYEVDVKITNAEQNWSKEQTITITSDLPITKWDKLVEQGGQYGWLYKHRIVNDLSALVKDSEPIYGKDGEKYFSVSLQGALFNYDYNKIYSVAGLCPKDSKIHYVPKPMIQSVVIYVSDTDTIMTAKEHMHYKVIYETTESQFAPLSESEQTQLRNLHSYNGTTHVFVDSGEVPCGIKLTYRKEN